MRYRLFGTSGLRVSELFLGAMTFGEQVRGGGQDGLAQVRAAVVAERRATALPPARRRTRPR